MNTPFGAAFEPSYEYHASLTNLNPRYGYSQDQHVDMFYRSQSGLPVYAMIGEHQLAVWRRDSGLTPANAYTDSQHFEAYYAQVPSFVRSSARANALSQRTVANLVPNPRFARASSGTTVVRRNLAPNPRCIPGGGALDGLVLTQDGTGPHGSYGYREPGSVSAWVSMNFVRSGYQLKAGPTVYTMRFWCATTVPLYVQNITNNITLSATWGGTLRLVSTGEALPNNYPIADGVWHEYYVTFSVPASQTTAWSPGVKHGSGTASADGWVKVTGIQIEERPALLPYFDGSTADNTGIAYSWEGTADASTSVASATVTEVRRNLAVNPLGDRATAATGYGTANNATVEFVSAAEGVRVTATAGGTKDSGVGFLGAILGSSVVAGRTYTISIDVTGEVADSWRLSAQGAWATGAVMTGNNPVAVPVGQTRRLSLTITPTSNGVSAIYLLRDTAATASRVRIQRVLFEEAVIAQPYFDGDTTPDADLTPVWTGTVNASASVLYGVAAASVAGRGYRSWYGGVTVSPKIGNTGTTDTYAIVGGDTGAMRLGMRAGQTYTALAKLKMEQAFGVPDTARSRRIVPFYKTATIGYTDALASPAPPDTAGTHTIRHVFTLPPDTTEAFIRLYNGGGPAQPNVTWTDFVLIEGVYTGDYFDGDMPGVLWEGTPHNSVPRKF